MLIKKEFLRSSEVRKFIDFLKSGFYRSPGELQKLLDDYNWPDNSKGLSFEKTFAKVSEMRTELAGVLNNRNENKAFEVCTEILNWGGVGVATKNIKELEKMNDQGSS